MPFSLVRLYRHVCLMLQFVARLVLHAVDYWPQCKAKGPSVHELFLYMFLRMSVATVLLNSSMVLQLLLGNIARW